MNQNWIIGKKKLHWMYCVKFILVKRMVGFHVTQVKNKIAYHSINKLTKLRYFRKVPNRQPVKGSGLYDILYLTYSAKFITQNHSYGKAIWRPETIANI